MKIELFFDYNPALVKSSLHSISKLSDAEITYGDHHRPQSRLWDGYEKLEGFDWFVIDLSLDNFYQFPYNVFQLNQLSIGDIKRDAYKISERIRYLSRVNARVILAPPYLPHLKFVSRDFSGSSTGLGFLSGEIIKASLYENLTSTENVYFLGPVSRDFNPASLCATEDPFGPVGAANLAKALFSVVFSESLRRPKVICVDADNTLWGGEIGELGANGIELGGISPRGRAYQRIQDCLKRLKESGILLVMISKNEMSSIRAVFENNSEMILRESDFVALFVGWNNKSDYVRIASQELNLNPSDFLFIDDSPQEIAEVTSHHPALRFLDFRGNPFRLISLFEQDASLYSRSLSLEDLNRTALYVAERKRRNYSEGRTNSKIKVFETLQIEVRSVSSVAERLRVRQLLNKTNQFNAVSRRYSDSDFQDLLDDAEREVFAFGASDKFGNYGLISVIVVQPASEKLKVEDFVMSCRALSKGIEESCLNALLQEFEPKSFEVSFLQTDRNEPIKKFFMNYDLLDSAGNVNALDPNHLRQRLDGHAAHFAGRLIHD